MYKNFPKMNMGRFSEQYKHLSLVPMHATNPQPFTQNELEKIIAQDFNEIIKNVNLGFSADEGTEVLRLSIAKNLYANIKAEDIITHAGAQEALYCAFNALLKPLDKVLVISPVYEPLYQVPINIGCEVNTIHLDHSTNWSLDLNQVEKQFKLGCRLFIINFPHNPSGATITENQLFNIIQLCDKYGVWLLSDEVFRGLEHKPSFKLPAVADLYDKGISIGVISKAFAVPGLRIGWLVSQHKKLRDKVIDIKGYLSICNSQIDELLTSVILEKADALLDRNLGIIRTNKIQMAKIEQIFNQDVDIRIPNVGCCVFVQLLSSLSADEFVKNIAEQYGYLLYPQSLFNTQVNGFRMGFGNNSFNKFYTDSR
ncbi:MAG: aminotransferase class I/II-fold pyridoxal phosphate-dependent enzyme [Marinicellaceae bacterium]